MSLREHRLLFSVLPVPTSVRPTSKKRKTYFTALLTDQYEGVRNKKGEREKKLFRIDWKRPWPDLGPFPVELPQTLVLDESRLFLRGPEPRRDAGLATSRLSSKEETTQSLLSSRSDSCRHKHRSFGLNQLPLMCSLSLCVLTESSWTSSCLCGRRLTPPAGLFTDLSDNCISTFLARLMTLSSIKQKQYQPVKTQS